MNHLFWVSLLHDEDDGLLPSYGVDEENVDVQEEKVEVVVVAAELVSFDNRLVPLVTEVPIVSSVLMTVPALRHL